MKLFGDSFGLNGLSYANGLFVYFEWPFYTGFTVFSSLTRLIGQRRTEFTFVCLS